MPQDLPPLLVLSDKLKRRIQADLSAHVESGVIGPPGYRTQTIRMLNNMILERYATMPEHDCSIRTRDYLVNAAESFYAIRTDYLSVTDYVTDFPDIVRLAGLSELRLR